MRLRLPITGQGFGPGGKLSFLRRVIFLRKYKDKMVRQTTPKAGKIWVAIGGCDDYQNGEFGVVRFGCG